MYLSNISHYSLVVVAKHLEGFAFRNDAYVNQVCIPAGTSRPEAYTAQYFLQMREFIDIIVSYVQITREAVRTDAGVHGSAKYSPRRHQETASC